jgi:fibro-slime domain-containing protein
MVGQEQLDASNNPIPCTSLYYQTDASQTDCQKEVALGHTMLKCTVSNGTYQATFAAATVDGNPLFFPVDNDLFTPLTERSPAQIAPYYDPSASWPFDLDASGTQRLHNFSFTSEARYWFLYNRNNYYTVDFVGDDDVWIFINRKLAVDLGGIHTPVEGSVTLDAPTAASLGLVDGQLYEIAVFQAERQTTESSYKLTLTGFNSASKLCAPCSGTGPCGYSAALDAGGTGGTTGSSGDAGMPDVPVGLPLDAPLAGAGGGGTGGSGGTTATGGASSTAGTTSSGGATTGGTTSTGTNCQIIWDWEGTTADSWAADTDVTLAVSTTQKLTGTQSLKATIPALTSKAADDAGAAATTTVKGIYITPLATSNMWPGATVTVHAWVSAGTTGLWMLLFMESNNWTIWDDSTMVNPAVGAWTTLTFTVPSATAVFPGGINVFGIQFGVSGGGTFAGGDVFVDSITVCGGTQSCSGTGTGSFDFETAGSTNGWTFKGSTAITDTVVTQSTTQHYGTTGSGSLQAAMTAIPAAPTTADSTSRLVELGNPQAYCGQTVTYHVMADNVTGLTVQPYASANGWVWFAGNAVTLTAINTWTTVTFTLPTTINFLGLQAMGLQLSNASTTAAYTGNVYIDGVTWQ